MYLTSIGRRESSYGMGTAICWIIFFRPSFYVANFAMRMRKRYVTKIFISMKIELLKIEKLEQRVFFWKIRQYGSLQIVAMTPIKFSIRKLNWWRCSLLSSGASCRHSSFSSASSSRSVRARLRSLSTLSTIVSRFLLGFEIRTSPFLEIHKYKI